MNEDQIFNMSDEEFEKEYFNFTQNRNNSDEPLDDNTAVEDNNDVQADNNQDSNYNFDEQLDNDGELDNSTEDDDNQQYDDNQEPSKSNNLEQTYKIKANGQELEVSIEELKQLASKGIDYTKKTQQLSKHKSNIKAIEDNNISLEDLYQLSDMLKGDKNAIKNFLDKVNFNQEDMYSDESNSYKPNIVQVTELDEVISDLKENYNNEYNQLEKLIPTLDDSSKSRIANDPNILRLLATEISTGEFDKVMPYVRKDQLLNGMSFLDSYVKNAKALISQKQNNNPNNKSTQVSKNKVKLSGSNGSNKSINRKEIKSAYDIGDDDEGYKLWEQNFDKGMYN